MVIDTGLLEAEFSFYKKLELSDKEKFLRRLTHFINSKNFSGRENLTVTERMKTLVSASAIQLTFGLNDFHLERFTDIIIYPKAFLSKSDNLYHKGETNTKGAIVFSWEDFEEGYANPDDKINLGLHEWAHALMANNFFASTQDEDFVEFYRYWQIRSADEYEKAGKEGSIFREYGGTNTAEFFAVAVEVFFETPKEFSTEAPVLFKYMCSLLNQFPMGDMRRHNFEMPGIERPFVKTPGSVAVGGKDAIKPWENYLFFGLLAAIITSFIYARMGNGGVESGIAFVCIVIVSLLFEIHNFLRKKFFPGYSLYLSPDKLILVTRKGMIKKEYFFEDLSGIGVEYGRRSANCRIQVKYPEGSGSVIERIPVLIRINKVEDILATAKKMDLVVVDDMATISIQPRGWGIWQRW